MLDHLSKVKLTIETEEAHQRSQVLPSDTEDRPGAFAPFGWQTRGHIRGPQLLPVDYCRILTFRSHLLEARLTD